MLGWWIPPLRSSGLRLRPLPGPARSKRPWAASLAFCSGGDHHPCASSGLRLRPLPGPARSKRPWAASLAFCSGGDHHPCASSGLRLRPLPGPARSKRPWAASLAFCSGGATTPARLSGLRLRPNWARAVTSYGPKHQTSHETAAPSRFRCCRSRWDPQVEDKDRGSQATVRGSRQSVGRSKIRSQTLHRLDRSRGPRVGALVQRAAGFDIETGHKGLHMTQHLLAVEPTH